MDPSKEERLHQFAEEFEKASEAYKEQVKKEGQASPELMGEHMDTLQDLLDEYKDIEDALFVLPHFIALLDQQKKQLESLCSTTTKLEIHMELRANFDTELLELQSSAIDVLLQLFADETQEIAEAEIEFIPTDRQQLILTSFRELKGLTEIDPQDPDDTSLELPFLSRAPSTPEEYLEQIQELHEAIVAPCKTDLKVIELQRSTYQEMLELLQDYLEHGKDVISEEGLAKETVFYNQWIQFSSTNIYEAYRSAKQMDV